MTEIKVKEHPIIFSTDMVKAILDGRKTQTRRILRPQPYLYIKKWVWAFRKGKLSTDGYWLEHCPYGQVGDRLWVRETWRTERRIDSYSVGNVMDAPSFSLWYKTTSFGDGTVEFDQQKDGAGKWRPSIHMPRWASRITLEITGIRVERLQEIDYEYNKEGCKDWTSFVYLWDSLNAKRGYGWEVNPWVWMIEFKVWCLKK